MTTQNLESDSNRSAAQLGARHSLLLHSILFGATLIREGVHRRTYRVDDERSAAFESTAVAVCRHADELDTMGKLLLHFDNDNEAREFLRAAHADTLGRLQRSWDLAYDRLKWPAVELPRKATRELDRAPNNTYAVVPDADLGTRFADLTYWAVEALRDLDASSHHPHRPEGDQESSLKHDIRNTKALLYAIKQLGRHLDVSNDTHAARVLAQFDAQTRLRTRMYADDLANRLRPLRG